MLIHTKGLHPGQALRVADTDSRFDLDRVPAGVPVHAEVTGQRRDGGVVEAERVDRPTYGPDRQCHPRRRQIMNLTERRRRTRRLSATPDPHQPTDQGDPTEAGRVVQQPGPPAVPDREHPARWTAVLELAGLDGQHQPSSVVDLHVENVHAGNIEDRIGPGAPARTGTTHKVGHRRGFRSDAWSHPILEAPTPPAPDQHARPARHPMLRSEDPLNRSA